MTPCKAFGDRCLCIAQGHDQSACVHFCDDHAFGEEPRMTDHLRRLSELVELATDALEPKLSGAFVGNTARNLARELAQVCLEGAALPQLLERITALEAALEPFANGADYWNDRPGVHYDDSLELWQAGRTEVTVGDLRRAQSALQAGSETRGE